MASSKAQEIRVGIATVIAVSILVAGIIWGKGGGIGVDNRTVTIIFANASGLDVGAPVTFNGVRKGTVTAIDALPDGARVTAVVQRSVPLRSDAGAVLAMQELTGGKKVALITGKASTPLPDDGTIHGAVAGDLTAVLAQVDELGATVKTVLARVDTAVGALVAIVGTPEFRDQVRSTMANLESGSAAARDIAVNNKQAIGHILANVDQTVGELRTMVRETKPAVDRLLASAEGIGTDGRALLQQLSGTLGRADSLVANINGVASDLRTGKGLASRLLYDPAFGAQIDSTIKAVRSLIRNIDRRGVNLNIGFGGKD